jgi:hypothetical protein
MTKINRAIRERGRPNEMRAVEYTCACGQSQIRVVRFGVPTLCIACKRPRSDLEGHPDHVDDHEPVRW